MLDVLRTENTNVDFIKFQSAKIGCLRRNRIVDSEQYPS